MAVESTGGADRSRSADRSQDAGRIGDGDVGRNMARSLAADMAEVQPDQVQAEVTRIAANDEIPDGFENVTARSHTVQPGDTMSHIARDRGVSLGALIEANPQIRDPNLIHPGEELTVPPRGTSASGPVSLEAMEPGSALARGSRGAAVAELQGHLNELGYAAGQADGVFGPITQSAVRRFQMQNDLNTTGRVDPATAEALRSPEAQRYEPTMGDVPELGVYPPGSPEQVALFEEAARQIGVPEAWASDPGLTNILRRESGGQVGIPNYTYGQRARDPSQWAGVHAELQAGRITARSSATGLGQLLLSNVERHYPSGRAGIGNPVEEAAGMLSYIRERYGHPGTAWARYNTVHEGY